MTCCAMTTRRVPSCWPTEAFTRGFRGNMAQPSPTSLWRSLAAPRMKRAALARIVRTRKNRASIGWPGFTAQASFVRLGWAFAALALGLGVLLMTSLRPSQPEPLAVVTRCLGAQTADSRGAIRPGQRLGPGRLSLDAGTVEVTIQNGARILLEGPATLELQTPMRAYLQAGRAVVHVPEAATGFVLETRDANVLDVGTEFGVKVGPDRGTEVQVYQGSVFTSAKSAGGRTNSPQRMLAGSAARLDPDATDTFQNLPFAPDRFVRQLPETKSGSKDTLPLSNQPRWDRIEIMPASQPVVVDGNLSEWDRQRMFRSQCDGTKDHAVEGALMYDADYLYVGAHVADPAPMRNLIDPATDGDAGWKGGGLQVRLSTDRTLGWPVDANADIYYQGQPMKQRPQDVNEKIVHLTLWHHAPSQKDCLHVSYGMDFHGGQTNPNGYRAAFRKDADGRGYTLEYAIPGRCSKPRAIRHAPATRWPPLGPSIGAMTPAAAGGGSWSRSAIPPNHSATTTGTARQAGARRCIVRPRRHQREENDRESATSFRADQEAANECFVNSKKTGVGWENRSAGPPSISLRNGGPRSRLASWAHPTCRPELLAVTKH